MNLNRRRALGAAVGAAGILGIEAWTLRPRFAVDLRKARSRVAVLNAKAYSDELEKMLLDGLRLFPIDVRGKCVLLKLDLSPKLRQTVKTQFSANGELCHGNATKIHEGV